MTVIIGMCDPSGKGPLLPHHPGSAGHRLWKMSGMDLETWLASFERTNLLPGKKWNDDEAVSAAVKFLEGRRHGEPVIALGRQVEKALKTAAVEELENVIFVPHPSGRSLAYNSAEVRQNLRSILNYFSGRSFLAPGKALE